ncbi:MAG: GNAT family N-acetyltransferase [Chloroflexota bacterium]
MDKIIIRPARREDRAEIRGIIWDAQINPFGLHWDRFVVAETSKDQIVGCGQIKLHGDGSSELASVAVREQFRGQRVGRKIIEKLVASRKNSLYLICRPELELFYNRFGFTSDNLKRLPPYFRIIYLVVSNMARIVPGNDRRIIVMVLE